MTARKRALQLAWRLARRRWETPSLSLVAAFGEAACTALIAERMGVLATPGSVALPSLALLAALILGRSVLVAARALCTTAFGRWFSHDLRLAVYQHLLQVGDLRALGRGDAVSRVLQDTNQLHVFASYTAGELVTQAALTVALVAVMARHDQQMTLLLLLSAPLISWVLARSLKRTLLAYRTLGERQARLSNEATELLGLLRLSKVFGAEDAFVSRFQERSLALSAQHGRVVLAASSLAPALLVVGLGACAALLVVWSRAEGPLLTPARVSFLTACALLQRPLLSAARSMTTLGMVLAAVDRIGDLIGVDVTMGEPAPAAPRTDGGFVLEVDGFAYERDTVLDRVRLRVQPGELVAIVGENGAGKSTLLELCLGLLKPTRGELTVSAGTAIPFTPERRRPLFSWMPQEPLIVSGSVLENVALGSPCPDAARAKEALQSAGALDLVGRLQAGLDTPLGESGRGLSRGEAQRVCLARAVYRDAPCLLLDEPTAFLDGIAAGELVSTVRSLRERTTLVVVTHALGLAAVADRVLVLERGRVVEEGRPAELWRARGAFFALFRAQHDPLSEL